MPLITDKTLKDKGFLPLPDGSFVYCEIINDEEAFIVIASRINEQKNMTPLIGWKFTSFSFCEYIELEEDLDDLMGII